MKNLFYSCLLAGTLLAPITYGAVHYAIQNETGTIQETSRIDLEGDLAKTGGLRSGTDPIIAELQGNILFISFQKNVGILQVTITTYTQESVYTTSTDTSEPSTLTIPLTGLPSGNYTITFRNESGTIWGNFEI